MLSEAKRLKMAPWVPAGFCAFLSLITVVGQIDGDQRLECGQWLVDPLLGLPADVLFLRGIDHFPITRRDTPAPHRVGRIGK
jgi:hypothetical protein